MRVTLDAYKYPTPTYLESRQKSLLTTFIVQKENGANNIIMETRLSSIFKDTKHVKYKLNDIITFYLITQFLLS